MQKNLTFLRFLAIVASLLVAAVMPALASSGPVPENVVRLDTVHVANGQTFAYPVHLQNGDPLHRITLPLKFTPGTYLNIDSVSFVGSRLNGLGPVTRAFDNATHTFYLDFVGNAGTPLLTGTGVIATLYLKIAQNSTTHDVSVDTAFSEAVGSFSFKDTLSQETSKGFVAGVIRVVTRRPVIHLDPDVFYFTATVDENPPSQLLKITNLGEDPLNWRITAKPSWIKTSSLSGTAPSDVDVMPDVVSMAVGNYFDSVAVTDSNAILKTVWAKVHLEITEGQMPNLGGFVYDTTHTPIPGAMVEIWDVFPTGTVLYSMSTTPSGWFGFLNVPTGDYVLYAYKDGYYPTKLNISAPNNSIPVTLIPTPPVNPSEEQWISLFCDENYFEGNLLPKGSVVEALDHDNIVCGQFFVHEVGKYGMMKVYRDDPLTPGIDEGADSNEVLTMHINTFDATPFPTPVWTYHNDVQEVCLNTDIIETRCIPLHKGWNLVSWNLDTPDDRIETITSDIAGVIDIVLGFEMGGATYDPHLPQFTTLPLVDHLHGYWFRMDCDTQLCVTGAKVDPRTPIDLEANWNLVSYLPDDQDSPDHALNSMYDKLVVALGYDLGGQTYDPAHPELATLDVMRPEFGYWLKTTAAATLVYPGPGHASGLYTAVRSTMKACPPAAGITATPEWIDLYGEGITLDGQLIPAGATLSVYDASGHLCGQAIVQRDGKIDFTPVYRDDMGTSAVEGSDYGDKLTLAVNGMPIEQTFTFTKLGDRIKLDALTSLGKVSETIPRSFALAQNFPNPFNPGTVIEFSLPVAAKATVEVFNVLGVKVNTLIDRFLPAGRYTVAWNGTDGSGRSAASGMYFYRLSAGDFSDTRKMLLVK
jgi:hypothetical protein